LSQYGDYMSYDLAVFDPEVAPLGRGEFLAWFKQQTEWNESHGYDNPKVCSPSLRQLFLEMIAEFPAMNGPHAQEELPEDEATLTDYSVGRSLIYAAFAWSKKEQAYEIMFRLAERHRVGFFNVSSTTGEVWLPGSSGALVLAHSS
jgi:hypothetical protein